MPLDPAQLNDLRRRVLEGKEWTKEELVAAIKEGVKDRIENLSMPKAAKKTATKKSNIDLNDLLG
jgi:hypothetical protein